MDNPFEYPEDRHELFEQPNEEEASVYFRLMDFQDLIKQYGVDFAMNRLDEEVFQQIAGWFLDEEDEEPNDWRNTDEA